MATVQLLLTVVQLQPLTLSGESFKTGASQGTLVGYILNASAGSAIAFDSLSVAGALQIVGTSIEVGPTPPIVPATITFNLIETLIGAVNTPTQTNSFSIAELVGNPTLVLDLDMTLAFPLAA